MSTNLEYRAIERQRKRESRRQASEAQREKGRQRSRARGKKQRRHFFVGRTTWNFCSSLHSKRDETRAQKKKKWGGRGKGAKETLARKPHDFEKLRSPTNAASDWRGAGSVDYLSLETSIKPGMLCFRASQIWSHLICGRRLQMLWTDIYWNRVCAKVYEIRVFKV